MAPRILVIDRNEAFATMLKDMLETDGGYEVRVTQRGSDALALLRDESFALTIIDMDLDPDDLGYRDLIPRVRKAQPSMRLMLIPLLGENLPDEVDQSDIQGTLAKPFFADDLLPGIEKVLRKEVSMAAQPPADARSSAPTALAKLETILRQLAREIYADSVLLLSVSEGEEHLIAHSSYLDEPGLVMLANLIVTTTRAAQAAAHFLGEPDRPFEHNMFETNSLRLYALSLPENIVLAVVTPTSTPLGTVRHNLRRSARELAMLDSSTQV